MFLNQTPMHEKQSFWPNSYRMRGLLFAILIISLAYLTPAFASGHVASQPLGAEMVASQSPTVSLLPKCA